MSGKFRFGIMGAGNIAEEFCAAVKEQGEEIGRASCRERV